MAYNAVKTIINEDIFFVNITVANIFSLYITMNDVQTMNLRKYLF